MDMDGATRNRVRAKEMDTKLAMENSRQVTSALDLMKRLPVEKLEDNLLGIISLTPKVHERVVSEFDEPLKVALDKEAGKEYIICAFNREDDSYRSPWSNTYDPPLDYEVALSDKLRDLEVKANNAFEHYRNMYFGGGVSSVYFSPSDCDEEDRFRGVILLKNTIGDSNKEDEGCWESFHSIEVHERPGGHTVTYNLSSTVTVWMKRNREWTGTMQIGGRIERYAEKTCVLNETGSTHIVNIGEMIENAENNIRLNLNEFFFRRTKVMCEKLYTPEANPFMSMDGVKAELRKAVQSPPPSPRDGNFRVHRREPDGTEVFCGYPLWRN